MISLYTIITFVFCHWLFDFFLQTDKMAQGKSKDNWALLHHVGTYWVGLWVMAFLNWKCFANPSEYVAIFVLLNAMLHFFTDWVTSRATSLLYKEERYHDFFTVIGADQLCHYVTLFGTFLWLSNLK